MSDPPFLHRWSKRKHSANRGEAPVEAQPPPVAPPATTEVQAAAPVAEPSPLPDVESLTPESDFAPFMREGVPDALRQRALKTLFQDPRFNVMDGLDVYIDDFSKPDPLPEGWLEKMNQVARLGDYREPEPEEEPKPEAQEGETTRAAPPEEGESTPPEAPDEASGGPPPADTSEPPPSPPEVPES